jgi:hypothetical protein
MKYSMTCDCGMKMDTDAKDREEAVSKIKGMMSEPAIKAHMADKHPGQAIPSVMQVHQQIEQSVQPA